MSLYEIIKTRSFNWRKNNYKCDCPVISEIFEFNYNPDTENHRFLRKAQYEALEIYWYLRLVEKTPHIFDLYKKIFTVPVELFKALNIFLSTEDTIRIMSEGGIDGVITKIKKNDDFVRQYRLQALKETISLSYPSYILALAMGAGKTILIGTIIATEFAMVLEYPDVKFVKNALVFAPGKTILGALKELSDIPYEKILPERLYKQFITSAKFTYTRDGEKDIPIIKGSTYNIIVTNTEKIRIRKEDIRADLFTIGEQATDDRKEFIANLRLQTIASLPHLGIFSDEAHHTYGQALGKELKRVRQTVDYLADKTNVLTVVNTTGTPYYEKQILKDVINWYGLSQGIKDGILKDVRGNIESYPEVADDKFLSDVIADFFRNYGDVKIFDGSPAKIAIYFPKIEDLHKAKPIIGKAMIENDLDPLQILEVHNESKDEIKDLFDNRINDKNLPYRVFLLVNKGTEGWNCLSLFACALARELKASNNFCLQAASRCLRQTPGNIHKAKIYLSHKNVKILDLQLKDTYGESLQDLNRVNPDLRREKLIIRKTEIPPISFKRIIRKVVPTSLTTNAIDFRIQKPDIKTEEFTKTIYDLKDIPDRKGVLIAQDKKNIKIESDYVDAYTLALELNRFVNLPVLSIYKRIVEHYPNNEIPFVHAHEITKQIEAQYQKYKITEEEVEVALALVKLKNFEKENTDTGTVYTTEIMYHKDREHLLLNYARFKEQNQNWYQLEFGFHYSPYNFDSNPEKDFYEQLLAMINEKPAEVEDIYFTGGITDRNKTDFIFEYLGKDDRWHDYTPDFLIKKKNGRILIIEVKAEPFKNPAIEKAIKEIEGLNPDKLKYEILTTTSDEIGFDNIKKVKDLIYEYGGKNE